VIGEELRFAEPRAPEGAERAVGRARHRVLRDPRRRHEEVRVEVIVARRASRDDHTAHRQLREGGVVRREAAHGFLRVELDEIVELVPADVRGRCAQGLDEARRHRRRLDGLCGEVQLDPVPAPVGGEETALRVTPRLAVARKVGVLPQHVGTREGGVATERHLDRGGEPAEAPPVALSVEEGALGEIHLPGNVLHPALVTGRGQDAVGRGVAAERRVGERVDLDDSESHGRPVYSASVLCLAAGSRLIYARVEPRSSDHPTPGGPVMEHKLDKQRTQEFARKLFASYTSGVLALMVDIGYTTGLFEAAAKGRGGSQEIAARAGLDERYVREWLCALAAGGVFEYDAASRTFSLPPEHAVCLTGTSSRNLAAGSQGLPMLARR